MQEQSHLLVLPRELRDEILLYLVLPQRAYTLTPKPIRYSRHYKTEVADKVEGAYIDTRIYLPVQPPVNVLALCKQLRDECLDLVARIANSTIPQPITDPKQSGGSEGDGFADQESEEAVQRRRDNYRWEEVHEQKRNAGLVSITMELLREFRGSMGSFTPERKEFSPRFKAFLPLLSRLKKIRFVIWGSWNWWKGPEQWPALMDLKVERGIVKRTTSDQTDAIRRPLNSKVNRTPRQTKPDPLSIALEAVLELLPCVEDVFIDVLMHESDYWNWDLPDVRYEAIQGWLNAPILPADMKIFKRVSRKLIYCESGTSTRSAVFFQKLEERDEMASNDAKKVINISEGAAEISVDLFQAADSQERDDSQFEVDFTKSYQFIWEREVCHDQ